MKITPDASLFQALSSFPRVNRDAINPTPHQAQGNAARVSGDAQSGQAARQEAIRKRATLERLAQSSSSSSSGQVSPDSNRSASPYNREAPGVDQKPAFKRLGQIIDISV